MEVLVVMVLITMITSLLIQGFSYMLQARQRLTVHLRSDQIHRLQSHWIHSLISGLAPAPDSDPPPFSGTATQMKGLSISTLTAPMGVPRHFSLSITEDETWQLLVYEQTPDSAQKTAWPLGRWKSDSSGFSYLDRTGIWHDKWPLDNPTGYQLPTAIRIMVPRRSRDLQWIVSIPGRRNPRTMIIIDRKTGI